MLALVQTRNIPVRKPNGSNIYLTSCLLLPRSIVAWRIHTHTHTLARSLTQPRYLIKIRRQILSHCLFCAVQFRIGKHALCVYMSLITICPAPASSWLASWCAPECERPTRRRKAKGAMNWIGSVAVLFAPCARPIESTGGSSFSNYKSMNECELVSLNCLITFCAVRHMTQSGRNKANRCLLCKALWPTVYRPVARDCPFLSCLFGAVVVCALHLVGDWAMLASGEGATNCEIYQKCKIRIEVSANECEGTFDV